VRRQYRSCVAPFLFSFCVFSVFGHAQSRRLTPASRASNARITIAVSGVMNSDESATNAPVEFLLFRSATDSAPLWRESADLANGNYSGI
jgi:hypothetical protein